jgi:hypothetical protein
MFKTKVATQISCPSCRLPVEEHWQFCHGCGETIKTGPAQAKKSGSPLILMAASFLALAFALIMGLTIFDFVQQYGMPGGTDVTSRASKLLSDGREESAVNLLEESLQVKPFDERAKNWRLMLDQALFARGKKLATEGKFRDAITAFARVSPNFAKHEEVEKLISEYTDKGLPSVFGKSEEGDPSLDKGRRPLSRLEKAVMTAVPGGKEHVDPLPSSIRQQVPMSGTFEQPNKP